MNDASLTIMPIRDAPLSLEMVGGKGQSLAILAAAGLPVPEGFLISTTAYRDFIDTNQLLDPILDNTDAATPLHPGSFELASSNIRMLFQESQLSTESESSIRDCYAKLGNNVPVAVRSSATAEDLPNLSFAGQQDSYLNIRGEAALLEAICNCWASLWTSRAISYRKQTNIDDRKVAMAVVIQVMVNADVSGILFTANPASGNRSELVINASFGLGEAIVGGQITPDSYVLDRVTSQAKETVIGSKEIMIVSTDSGGTETQPVPKAQREALSLPDQVLGKLASLSLEVEKLFHGQPQDIEWALREDCCWLLQSRPITCLPPPPLEDVTWEPPNKRAKLVRRQVVENMPEPLSPLFAELYLHEGLDQGIDQLFSRMGLPFSIGDFTVPPLFVTVNGFGYCRYELRFSWRLLGLIPRILYWYVRSLPGFLKSIVPQWQNEGLPAYLSIIECWKSRDLDTTSDAQLLSGVRALATADASYWMYITLVIGAAKITDGLLNRFLISRGMPANLTSGLFLRGFSSKTLQAQQELEAIAKQIHEIEALPDLVISHPAENLPETLKYYPAGEAILERIQHYLTKYGHLVYNLDFVQPTQIEDPLPIYINLQGLVRNPEYDTPARLAAMVREREALQSQTLARLGSMRRWLFRKLLSWAQHYGPYREEALFFMGAGWPTLRRLALALGQRLVAAGTLTTADEVFFLHSDELADACGARQQRQVRPRLKQTVSTRKELRERRKKLHAPSRVPEDLRFKWGPFDFTKWFAVWESQKRNSDDASTLNGFAVSPGKVTGIATLIHDPDDFNEMKPNTILVCPTTTPAWTPLFAQASGLVTDIGGILAHGSIVAREYGIPAVLGTGNATQRIANGQLITVNGNAGTVTIIG